MGDNRFEVATVVGAKCNPADGRTTLVLALEGGGRVSLVLNQITTAKVVQALVFADFAMPKELISIAVGHLSQAHEWDKEKPADEGGPQSR